LLAGKAGIKVRWFFAVFGGIGSGLGALPLQFPIPKGLNLSAQGCEERATLGKEERGFSTLKGLQLAS
jgi:hypothetical protein